MQISSTRQSTPRTGPPIQAKTQQTSQPEESWRKSETFEKITYGAAQVGGVATGIGAGVYASQFMPSGMSGIMGAVTGVVTGAVAGGATGLGVAEVTKHALSLDRYGDSMMKYVSITAGTVAGAVAGGVSGFFGAQPLLVAPATVAGGLAGTMALRSLQRAVTR